MDILLLSFNTYSKGKFWTAQYPWATEDGGPRINDEIKVQVAE